MVRRYYLTLIVIYSSWKRHETKQKTKFHLQIPFLVSHETWMMSPTLWCPKYTSWVAVATHPSEGGSDGSNKFKIKFKFQVLLTFDKTNLLLIGDLINLKLKLGIRHTFINKSSDITIDENQVLDHYLISSRCL